MSNEISFSDAISAIRKWYYSEVREWAEEYDRRIEAHEFDDREAFFDTLYEETDGAQIIIYTAQAKAVLLASDNEDAYEEEFGGTEDAAVEARALVAFQRDIQEAMQTDLSDDEVFEAPETADEVP